jgi:hypothetical protein
VKRPQGEFGRVGGPCGSVKGKHDFPPGSEARSDLRRPYFNPEASALAGDLVKLMAIDKGTMDIKTPLIIMSHSLTVMLYVSVRNTKLCREVE